MTARRWLLGTLLAIMLAGAFSTGERFFVAIALFVAAIALVGLIVCIWSLLGFKFLQTLTSVQAVKGDRITLRIELHNDFFAPFPFLKAVYDTPGSLTLGEPERVLDATVPARGSASVEEEILCPYRGVFEIGIKRVTATDALGLISITMPMRMLSYHKPLRLEVAPRAVPMPYFPLPTRLSEGSLSRRTSTQDEAIFTDTRAYRHGDSLRRVHWKVSARKRSLIVKQYQAEERPDALLLLDLGEQGVEGLRKVQLEDAAATAALSASSHLLQNWLPVRLVAYDPDRVQLTATKPADLAAISSYLAQAPFGNTYPMQDIIALETQNCTPGTAVVVVTANLTGALFDALDGLRARGIHLTVLVCVPPMAPDEFARRQVAELRAKGAFARLIQQESDLSAGWEVSA